MPDIVEFVERIAFVWAILSPFWLLTVAALAWGRVILPRAEIMKGLAWTAVVSVVAFPVMWAWFSHIAQINPEPRMSAAAAGALFAASLLPVYSALIACGAFGVRISAARKGGAVLRSSAVRLAAACVIAVVVLGGCAVLLLGTMFAAGPKAFG